MSSAGVVTSVLFFRRPRGDKLQLPINRYYLILLPDLHFFCHQDLSRKENLLSFIIINFLLTAIMPLSSSVGGLV